MRVAWQVSEAWCPTAISIQRNGFKAICGNAVRRVSDWHTNCFEKVRKEQRNENQDQREGWYHRRPHQPLTSAAKSESVANGANGYPIEKGRGKTMKTKTNVKAGGRLDGGGSTVGR